MNLDSLRDNEHLDAGGLKGASEPGLRRVPILGWTEAAIDSTSES